MKLKVAKVYRGIEGEHFCHCCNSMITKVVVLSDGQKYGSSCADKLTGEKTGIRFKKIPALNKAFLVIGKWETINSYCADYHFLPFPSEKEAFDWAYKQACCQAGRDISKSEIQIKEIENEATKVLLNPDSTPKQKRLALLDFDQIKKS